MRERSSTRPNAAFPITLLNAKRSGTMATGVCGGTMRAASVQLLGCAQSGDLVGTVAATNHQLAFPALSALSAMSAFL